MISKRLKTIASFIYPSKTIADIGCDHGYLIIEAFENQKIEKALAVDNKEMPLKKAINNLMDYDFFNKVTFSLSSGLADLQIAYEAIIFSGMGGKLIIDIIDADFDKLKQAKLIIQANRNVEDVRKYLVDKHYKITAEAIVFEEKKYYEIVVFEKTQTKENYSDDELIYGPMLLKERSLIFIEKLKNDLRILNKIEYPNHKIITKIKKIKELIC